MLTDPVAPWEFRKAKRGGKFQVKLPASFEGAMRLLQDLVPKVEQTKIASMKEAELNTLHFGLGQWIRNNLELWKGNGALLAATGETNAPDESAVIIPKVGAVCPNRARTDLCGGRSAMGVSTAIDAGTSVQC